MDDGRYKMLYDVILFIVGSVNIAVAMCHTSMIMKCTVTMITIVIWITRNERVFK